MLCANCAQCGVQFSQVDPIDSANGNNCTDMTNLRQVTPQQVQTMRVLLSEVQAGRIGDHLAILGRHLPDGKSGIRCELSALVICVDFC